MQMMAMVFAGQEQQRATNAWVVKSMEAISASSGCAIEAAPQQDALRGAITSYDFDGRCSYAATHKCYSTHNHWFRCLVVDHPDDAEFWGDVTEQYTSTRERKSLVDLVRCERCAVCSGHSPRVRGRLLRVVGQGRGAGRLLRQP